jgi:biotin operon repressor
MNTTHLLNALARHQGAANGVRADQLAQRMGISERRLRTLITRARESGVAVCGKPNTGYFMPTTADELRQTCAFLESRAMCSLRSLSRMRNIALPVLMGQLLLAKG